MSPSLVISNALLALLLVCTARSSQALTDDQIKQICPCTNYTEPCTMLLTSVDEFKSAPNPKDLAPLVIQALDEAVNETSSYVNSLAKDEKIKDENLKRLYVGCGRVYEYVGANIHDAIDKASDGANLSVVKDQLSESREFVDECMAGPKVLNVTDPSDLSRRNEVVIVLLNLSTCSVQFASQD